MSDTLRIVLLVGIVLYFIILGGLLKKRRLQLKYTLLWIVMGLIFLLMAIFPNILVGLRNLLGFQDNMNTLYVILIGFIIILVMAVTSIVSHQSESIKKLAQENALLEKRIRELEGDKDSEES